MRTFIFLIISFLLQSTTLHTQTIVYNPKLLVQINKNHAVRTTSISNFEKTYEEQKEIYLDIQKKMTQVVAIHEFIYSQLYNINSLFKQGKQLKYIYEYFSEIQKNGKKMIELSYQNPQHIIWIKKYYNKLLLEIISLKDEIEKNIIKPNKEILMDAYDRDYLIDRIYMKLRQINISILSINNLIEFAKSRAYIYSIPVLGNFIIQDKQLVEEIMQKYRNFQHY